MIKNIFKLLLGLMFINGTIFAQKNKSEFLFKAMQDELGRNMKELSLPGMERPFFMEYAITEGKAFNMRATLGSINSINDNPFSRGSFVRVLVGNNHQTNTMYYETGRFPRSNPVTTVDDNYVQLKRDLWLQTDIAYKSAAQEYSIKMALLKKKNLSQEEAGLDDFAKVKPVEKVSIPNNVVCDKVKISHLIEDLSAIFKDYPDIDNSDVSARFSSNDVYVVNSENSKYSFPNNILMIDVNVKCLSDGKTLTDNMNITVLQEKDLPTLDELKAEVKEFAERFVHIKKAQSIKDYYSGPVLFEGPTVATLFYLELFSGTGVYATRESVQGGGNTTLQEKMNYKVTSDDYTVKCVPFLEEYGGKKLAGHFDMDIEGIVPDKELVLIENGILKNVIGSRMQTKCNKVPSGYFRAGSTHNRLLAIVNPGVVDINTSRGVSKDSLKKLLIKTAREKGFTYAYIVRKLDAQQGPSSGSYALTYLYKVNVDNGSEEMVKDAEIRGFRNGIMKLVMGTSNTKTVVNTSFGLIPVTYICPDAVLFPDLEIARKKNTQNLPPSIVPNPLKDKI